MPHSPLYNACSRSFRLRTIATGNVPSRRPSITSSNVGTIPSKAADNDQFAGELSVGTTSRPLACLQIEPRFIAAFRINNGMPLSSTHASNRACHHRRTSQDARGRSGSCNHAFAVSLMFAFSQTTSSPSAPWPSDDRASTNSRSARLMSVW